MKMRKAMLAFLAAICILASVCTFGVFAEGTSQVYAETSISVQQGEYGYCYVYLDDLTDLASLNVAVHYDTQKVTVTDSYNQVACSLYDSSNQNGCLQYSYIFDGEGSNTKTNLFYFCYQVNENAELGSTYFDIVVTDAYNTAIEPVDISGSRCYFTITEKTVAKTAYIYGPSDMETSVKEEFEISYSLGDWQIASGSMVISYDPELFEFVELMNGEFLNGKIVDVNTSLDGSVYLSFLATEYNYYRSDLLKIKFRTLKNVTDSSEIKLTVSELYDLDLNRIICDGYTTNIAITHDATYTEDSPSMSLSASYDAQTDKVTVTVLLEKDSHLGAGDFVLNFDTNYLTYSSATKGFAPSFFNINDKNIDEGILKFSIISLSDITDGQTVLTVVFDTKRPCQDTLVDFEISGSGLADSLTNPILLNFVDANVTVPLEHADGNDNNHLCDKGCGTIADDGCYDDNTDHACDECGATGMGDHSDGSDSNHLCDYGCGQVADDGCHDVNTDADHKCDECGKDNVTVCRDSGKDHICDTDNACVRFSTGTNTHADGNDANHTCDYCGVIVAGDVCVDTNPKNHICDECGVTISECDEGETVDGKCDYCGNPVDHEHVDANKDHECDYDDCTAIVESHTDIAPKDHKCDSYGDACIADKVAFGEHSDGDDADHFCDYGCGQVADEGCHGGTATCAAQAVCVECGNSYGALGDHAYGELIEATEAVHTQTELTGAVAAHYFCDVCDKYFTETKDETTLEALTGEAPIHTPNADDGDCTTAISCSVCGKITTPANVSHTGGTATCENKAECTVCGKEYGDPKGHSYSSEWSKDDTRHWHECGCGDKTDEAEHSYGEWTITKEATTTEKGSKTKSCVCGHSLTEEIPATGSSSGNEDEENSNEGNLITEPDVDNDGLSGGAIAGVVAGSVVVVSIGGFSLFWFAIKKKSWAELLKVFKK